MKNSQETRELLIAYYLRYPKMQIQDIFKFIYQSSFGCEHLVSQTEAVEEQISREYNNICSKPKILTERLDGEYSRVSLCYLGEGLSAKTLAKLFSASAKKEADAKIKLVSKLETVRELVLKKLIPFEKNEFEKAVLMWENDGFGPIHHSDVFRESYNPSYRVISNKYVKFLPLFARIDKMFEKGNVKLAIEGGSASGKTTLSLMLESIYDCTVFHMDDFFLRPEQRTPQRYAEIGGNIDRERFLDEVLNPLVRGEEIGYKRFNCSTMTLSQEERIIPKKLAVIEGAYSMHPELSPYYDLSVFLDVSPKLQRERIEKRNSPDLAKRFFNEWIVLENKYFSQMNIKEQCDLCIPI